MLCGGNCLFTSGTTVLLRLTNATEFLFEFYFQSADPTPMINPPATLAEWGTPIGGRYRVPCPVCVPLGTTTNETLTVVP